MLQLYFLKLLLKEVFRTGHSTAFRGVPSLLPFQTVSRSASLEPGGGGYSTNVYAGRLRPEAQPLTL